MRTPENCIRSLQQVPPLTLLCTDLAVVLRGPRRKVAIRCCDRPRRPRQSDNPGAGSNSEVPSRFEELNYASICQQVLPNRLILLT
jgi:hypothetical protein